MKKKDGQRNIPGFIEMKQVQEIARDLESGISAKDLAANFGVHLSTIYKIKAQYTDLPQKVIRSYSLEEKRKSMEYLERTKDIAETSKHFNIPERTLKTWARNSKIVHTGTRRKYTKEFKEKLAERYRNGESVNEIAKEHGLNEGLLYAWLHKMGVDIHYRKHYIIPQETRDEALALFKGGMAISSIAHKFGISNPTLYRWLKDEGLLLAKEKYMYDSKTSGRIMDLWNKGYPTKDIADIMGLPESSVRYHINNH